MYGKFLRIIEKYIPLQFSLVLLDTLQFKHSKNHNYYLKIARSLKRSIKFVLAIPLSRNIGCNGRLQN